MVSIEIEYRGGLRCEAVHGPSGARLLTDAPVDNHGKGEAFSPTDLAATAMGTCMLTVMGIVADRHGIDIIHARAVVEKEMSADPRRIASLTVTMHLPAALSPEDRERLESAAVQCPVCKSLSPDVKRVISFSYE